MESADLDAVLFALANPHRRDMVRFLGLQPSTISRLAALRELSLPAIHKHVAVLEDAGLVSRRKVGRSTVLTLQPRALRALQEWLGDFHTWWDGGHASLENYAAHLDHHLDPSGPGSAPEEESP